MATSAWQTCVLLLTTFLLIFNICFYIFNYRRPQIITINNHPLIGSIHSLIPADRETPLALFTTFSSIVDQGLPPATLITNWSSLLPFVRPILFVSKDADAATLAKMKILGWELAFVPVSNRYGSPVLSNMFQYVIENYNATYYGYARPGARFTESSLLETLKTVYCQEDNLKHDDTILVGRRWNSEQASIPSQETMLSKYSKSLFRTRARGRRNLPIFKPDIIDYVITTPRAIKWHTMAPVVVGRAGLENYILLENLNKHNVIDVSETVQCSMEANLVHIKPKSNADLFYNKRMLGRQYRFQEGRLDRAAYESRTDISGSIFLAPKPRVVPIKQHVVEEKPEEESKKTIPL
ncbi:hypothetical protein CAPTEDRAFT_188155 [Capitella teleta]|uniref:Uncharacterized protein n=1 Tax=Capitella teleta TaxID=283909 RepID=R7UZQ5_CAPTE|nr:hypothetical protein CAPTEDRAFT_188155 [Capitella teleta]|eukprot:ELU12068.1 hypothetical protein CAPTEDRAFT_188155 [Capitella teleta]